MRFPAKRPRKLEFASVVEQVRASLFPPAPEQYFPKLNGRELSIEEFAGKERPKRKRSKGPRSCAKAHEYARAEAQRTIDAKGWHYGTPSAIVGLYSLLHEKVYGVAPSELDGMDYMGAISVAKRVNEQLTPIGVYGLLRWTWREEQEREKRRRDSGTPTTRIGWRLQFHASKITDFKVAQARAGRRL